MRWNEIRHYIILYITDYYIWFKILLDGITIATFLIVTLRTWKISCALSIFNGNRSRLDSGIWSRNDFLLICSHAVSRNLVRSFRSKIKCKFDTLLKIKGCSHMVGARAIWVGKIAQMCPDEENVFFKRFATITFCYEEVTTTLPWQLRVV